jgi:hypothetical protein
MIPKQYPDQKVIRSSLKHGSAQFRYDLFMDHSSLKIIPNDPAIRYEGWDSGLLNKYVFTFFYVVDDKKYKCCGHSKIL